MEAYSNYLLNERLLGLSAGLIGVGSILLALLFLAFLPQFKAFSVAMLVLGALEAGIFLTGYFVNQEKVKEKTEAFSGEYAGDRGAALEAQTKHAEKTLRSFFMIKVVYAVLLLVFVIMLSKVSMKPVWVGILTALVIHLALAITIDNFGERYTRTFRQELLELTG